jgi:predicted transcriptional regulator
MPELPRQLAVRKTEQKIVMIIRENSKDGINHSQLADLVGINRKNLRPYTKRLIAKGIIKRGQGRHGKYYPADKEHRDNIMDADILGTGTVGFVLQKDDIPLDTHFLKNVEMEDSLQYALFKFSNKVGAIITYLLIQAMNPANRVTDGTKSNKEKDLDIQYWLDSATSSLRLFSLPIFQDTLGSCLHDFKYLIEDFTNKDGSFNQNKAGLYMLRFKYNEPSYILEEKMIHELMIELRKTYPSITAELERVRAMVPRAVANQLHDSQHKLFRSETQKKCAHRFEPVQNKTIHIQSGITIRHCKKCHKTKRYS